MIHTHNITTRSSHNPEHIGRSVTSFCDLDLVTRQLPEAPVEVTDHRSLVQVPNGLEPATGLGTNGIGDGRSVRVRP